MNDQPTERCPHGVLIYQDCYHCGPLKTERAPDKDAARAGMPETISLKDAFELTVTLFKECQAERDALKAERDELQRKGESLCVQNGTLMIEMHDVKKERDALKSRLADEEMKRVEVAVLLAQRIEERDSLRAEVERLRGTLLRIAGVDLRTIAPNTAAVEHFKRIAQEALAPSDAGETDAK